MNIPMEQRAVIEANLRAMSWKKRVESLVTCVKENHLAVELHPTIRRWFELNRNPSSEGDEGVLKEELQQIMTLLGQDGLWRWLDDKVETMPISGWVVNACHFLKDNKEWWLFIAQRHDDRASLVGTTVPAPATKKDLRKLGRIIERAGGNPRRELLRTGAITKEEQDDFIASGNADIAEYGEIFFWWPSCIAPRQEEP